MSSSLDEPADLGAEEAAAEAWQRAWDAALSDDERKAEVDAKISRLFTLEADAPLGPPTVVMGIAKSGTSAMAAALRDAGVPRVFQIHSLLGRSLAAVEREYRASNPGSYPLHVWDSQYLGNRLPTPDAPWRLVVTIREPVGQLVAAYFQTASRRGELVGATVDSLLARFDHDFGRMVLQWFDLQLRDTLGLDIYTHPFDPAVGYCTIDRDDLRALVIRRESLDRAPQALAAFLDRAEPVPLPRSNVAADKDYAQLYDDFRTALRPSAEVLDRAYESRMVRHFYSAEEIAGFRARWTG